ncbi:MAG TPA: hypothetical protein VGG72_20190 [Bryobacteraceae bacterium]
MSEDVRHTAPANVTGEGGLFVLSGLAVFRFERLQETDRSDIIARLLMQPALSNPVRAGYSEVAGRFFLGLDVQNSSGGKTSSVAGSYVR